MTKKLFEGAHQARVDVDTAARVIGYSSSTGGAAASAIGALRQFGLVDGLRGDVGVSDLAMRILQPLDSSERAEALHEAAKKPEIFGRMLSHFGGDLPASDEPVRAFLIRQEGFSTAGANELIGALRETLASLRDSPVTPISEGPLDEVALRAEASNGDGSRATSAVNPPQSSRPAPQADDEGELIILPLGSSCRAELRFVGDVGTTAYDRLIRHLQLLKEMLDEDDKVSRMD